MSHCVTLEAERGGTARPRGQALLWLAALYPVLVPFYLMGRTLVPGTQRFASGVPQIADYYLASVMVLTFMCLPLRVPPPIRPVALALTAFVAYGALVNGIWTIVLEDPSMLKSTLFYAYDLLLFMTALMLFDAFRERFVKVALYGVVASVVFQALLSPLAMQQGYSRQSLFFNDENQLGYFCLLSATVFVLGARQFALALPMQIAFYAAAGYLAMMSQCRGALAGLGVLLVVAVFDRPVRLVMALAGLTIVYLLVMTPSSIVGKSETRLVSAGEYDSLEGRGYDRILNHPEYVVFGAGEGAYERFRSALFGSEIHSSYGTVLFCYGFVGAAIFVIALLGTLRLSPRLTLFLIPAFVYGSAHHGLRAAFFWFMFAFLCCVAAEKTMSENSPVDEPAGV